MITVPSSSNSITACALSMARMLGQTEFVLFAAAFFLIQLSLMLVAIVFQRLRGWHVLIMYKAYWLDT
ncbi:MAG: hypothetical protein U9P00_10620 [Pseudomonadota bacterium]|nr:hypothetical protein [Pseudomonadota bacterium]